MVALMTKEGGMARLVMTKTELGELLQGEIRKRARFGGQEWGSTDDEVSFTSPTVDEEKLKKLTSRVYDDIRANTKYDDTLLKATRAVKFNQAYVKGVIRAGIKSGVIGKMEAIAAAAGGVVDETFDELEASANVTRKRKS